MKLSREVQHCLDVYGTDLSRWPVDILKDIDIEELMQMEAFQHEVPLDEMLLTVDFPQPSDALRNAVMERVSAEPKSAFLFGVFTQNKPVRLGMLMSVMVASFFTGALGGNNSRIDYHEQPSSMESMSQLYGSSGVMLANNYISD